MNKKRWTSDRLVLFSQHLSNLLGSGFPLLPSIRLLAEQELLSREEGERITTLLDQGWSFSDALKREGLPPLFVSFLRAAEEHGDMEFGLQQCETYYRERGKLLRELGQALTYPAVVLVLVGIAFSFMVTTVIPRFAEMYETMGLTLPHSTRMLISFYDSFRTLLTVGAVIGVFTVLFFLFIRRLPREHSGPMLSWICRLPMIRSYFALRFTHYLAVQMGSLLRSGIPLLRVMEILESLTPWHPLAVRVERIKNRLLAGESLNRSLAEEGRGLLLPSLPRLVALGEETGRLDQSLITVARGTEILIRERLNRLTRHLEPVLIFVIGSLMAVTVIAMFLPMLNLVRAL